MSHLSSGDGFLQCSRSTTAFVRTDNCDRAKSFLTEKGSPWILNFAVKDDWRKPSRMEWVESCLKKFAECYRGLGIKSVAMPWIGAMNGQLPWEEVHALMRSYLSNLNDISVEVIEFDPHATDPLFEALRDFVGRASVEQFRRKAVLTEYAAQTISLSVKQDETRSLAEVSTLPGLGKKTIDNLYAFLSELAPMLSS